MAGYIQNIIGLGPNRSGTLYGVTNGFGNLSGFLVPEITKRIVGDFDDDVDKWRWLFVIAASLYTLEAIYFCLAASAEVQEFNHKSYSGVTTAKYFRQELVKLRKLCGKQTEKSQPV